MLIWKAYPCHAALGRSDLGQVNGADSSAGNLNNAVMRGALMAGFVLMGAKLNKAALKGVDLSGADLSGC